MLLVAFNFSVVLRYVLDDLFELHIRKFILHRDTFLP